MSLDPTASPWPGVIASVAVCLWIAALGAPLAAAAFRHRPRLVWPGYAPILGVAVVLLITNLASYVIPGAPAAWFGLLAPSVAALVILWRLGPPSRPSRRSALVLLAMALVAVGVFALAYANRLHTGHPDAAWHDALAFQLARGVFPPITPYGVDASPIYHYGHNLLAASVMNTAGVFPWTAFDALRSFLVAVLVLAVAGFAYDVGSPLPLALGLGAVVGFFPGQLLLGIDAGLLEPSSPGRAFQWLDQSQWALALGFVVLVAAALHGGTGRRQAAVVAASAGVFAMAEAAVMIFACAALALVGTARLLRLRGRERFVLAAALFVSAGLVLLAGGPVSDMLFGRGGSTPLAHIAWEPVGRELRPVQPAGPWLVAVGIIPLTVIGAFAAYRRRSWGLSFLVAAGAGGLLEAQLLQAQTEINEVRIFGLALVVATIGALAGLGPLIGALRGSGRRLLALALLGLLVLLPTSLPHAISGVQLALMDLETVDPATDDSGHHYQDRAYFGAEVAANWEYYDWLRRSLPNDARLLSRRALLSAAAAGIASPRSGRDLQVFSLWVATWVYADALRFLHRDDFMDMGITHLHVTDRLAAGMAPSARRLLDDRDHLTLLADITASAGTRHRVFAVRPGAGTTDIDPSSYRALRRIVPSDAPVAALGSLTSAQRGFAVSAFADHAALGASYRTGFDRASRVPHVEVLTDPPESGVVVVREPLEPTALGLSRDEALWRGHGLRAYDLGAAWSPAGRVGPRPAPLPDPMRATCDSADGLLDLRVLGEPGTILTAGSTLLTLTGLPQILTLTVPDCAAFTLSAPAAVAPFFQLRSRHRAPPAAHDLPIAALAFDGGVASDRAVLHLWYRNPQSLPFVTGTELRLYAASPLGVGLTGDNPNPRVGSLRWWPGPLALRAPEQTARLEFDARRLEINGNPGAGAARLVPGQTYLLALTVAGADPHYSLVEIQHIVPLARVVVGDAGVAYEMLTGIAAIEHHTPGTILQRTGYDGGLTENPDRTPR